MGDAYHEQLYAFVISMAKVWNTNLIAMDSRLKNDSFREVNRLHIMGNKQHVPKATSQIHMSPFERFRN